MKKTRPEPSSQSTKKRIRDVFTIIWKGRQKVGFVLENNPRPVFLTPENVQQNTGIGIDEVEILIGSMIRPEFYRKGDKLFNGQTCLRDNMLVRSFWISPSGDPEQMRQQRVKQVPLRTIKGLFRFEKNERKLVGLETEAGDPIIINSNSLEGLTRIHPEDFEILIGSKLAPEYYQQGEEMEVGGVCRKSNTIIKNLNLRFQAKVPEMVKIRQEYTREANQPLFVPKGIYPEHENSYSRYGGVFGYDDETIEFGFLGDPSNLWFED